MALLPETEVKFERGEHGERTYRIFHRGEQIGRVEYEYHRGDYYQRVYPGGYLTYDEDENEIANSMVQLILYNEDQKIAMEQEEDIPF